MNKRNLIDRSVRYALITAAAALASHASTALAANSNESPAKLGKVTVTGSRIKRTDIETAQPVFRISRQQIQRSGYTNIGQLLKQYSFNGPVFSTTTNSGGDGQSYINLRDLGSSRTLVLVNGKRWLQGLGGSVNLNTIPVSIIDHIEILQDGASAVYGSDAIAGVLNIITVKNFRGAEAHAHYGIRNDSQTGRWDGQVKQYDFTVGSGNDRGNVVFNATYKEQNPTFAGERNISKEPVFGTGNTFGSSGTPKGRFQLFGPAVSGRQFGQGQCSTYDPGSPGTPICSLTLINAPTTSPSLQNFRDFTDPDHFNFAPQNYLQTPLKNVSAYVQGHYDLADNVTFTANAEYVRGESTDLLAPDPVAIGAAVFHPRGRQPITISASDPYNPFGMDLVSDSGNPCIQAGSCIGASYLDRRLLEAGPRIYDFNRDSFHVFAGFNGYVNLFNREIDWDVGFGQNRVQQVELTTGTLNLNHLTKALGPASQCSSPCVPFNFFGGSVVGDGGSITQDQLNYLEFEAHSVNQTNLRDWTANLSSDLYDLPAGPLGIAVGYEREDSYGYFHPDALVTSGATDHVTTYPTNGRLVTDAEYAEINIPLLADLPFVKSLSIDIANRWSQFKRSGGREGQNETTFTHDSSGRLNLRYQVNNDLLLRATWSQGFRSPTIDDLFSGGGTGFPNLTDPCAPSPGTYTGGALPPNCPNGTQDFQGSPQIATTGGGNPKLQPEHSISRTVGFVYSPSQVPGLDVNADYYKIELNNTLSSLGAGNIINGCFYNSTFCNLITVRGNQITNVRNTETNVGGELTEGIDFGLHYKFPSTPIGDFDTRINGTFLKTFDFTEVNLTTKTGFATSHDAGVANDPKRRFNGYLNWDYGNWSAQYHIEYYGSVVEGCYVAIDTCTYPNRTTNFQGVVGQLPARNRLGATIYHDVNVSYTVPNINTTFTLGVRNLFDKKPPLSRANVANNYYVSAYRLPSRLIYGDIRVRF